MSPEHVALQAAIDELVDQWRLLTVDLTAEDREQVTA